MLDCGVMEHLSLTGDEWRYRAHESDSMMVYSMMDRIKVEREFLGGSEDSHISVYRVY